ncbi:RHS repeat-associated core domain-containing protein [uncultured Clostridium sp.]|uniref:RHS repeat-associated core domain-containing protein n=1 Tax=uncultured Clostridium sp. TaxID=59620 RepID=UPI0032163559
MSLKAVVEKNPYRYRGYRYDTETGYYYLQSRYYNPEWGRFLNADGLVSTGQGFIGYNMFAYCLNSPVNRRDDNGLRSGCITEGVSGGSYTSTPSNSGEVERSYFSIPNLMGSIAGTVLGAVENVTRTCKAYLYNGSIRLYPASSIMQKIKPYAAAAKKSSAMIAAASVGLDIASTWDSNMSLEKKAGKTLIQLSGVGVAYLVGTRITGPMVAAGIEGGPVGVAGGVIGAFAIDYLAGKAINYGQSILYRKFGME